MTQGERVKQIRKSLNLTLDKFGEKLGVKKGALSSIENGRNSLTDQMAISICRAYNVSYDYLMYGEGEMFSSLPDTVIDELCSQFDLDVFDRSIVELYVSLPEDVRRIIKKKSVELLESKGIHISYDPEA